MDSTFKKIREGSEIEAEEIYENLQKTAIRGAIVAIATRNNSHGLGDRIKDPPPRK